MVIAKYYSAKEIFLRLSWSIVYPFLFRYSPRQLYGWRNLILRIFGSRIGKNVKIYPSVKITLPWLLDIGAGSVIAWDVRLYNLGKITIGKKTVISQNAHLCGGTHDFRNPGFKLLRTGLSIGNHVWIAADAFIGPSVHVADNAVVAARAVVVKNVPQGTVVGGNPAKIISQRGFDNLPA